MIFFLEIFLTCPPWWILALTLDWTSLLRNPFFSCATIKLQFDDASRK
ncbi:MAG TPA: hypothetical protein VKT28_02525 [Puia sp.]|nr:hypothetical protein [Puia sp.]